MDEKDVESALPVIATARETCEPLERKLFLSKHDGSRRAQMRRWGGRLLSLTFMEDGLRLLLNLNDEVNMLHVHRTHAREMTPAFFVVSGALKIGCGVGLLSRTSFVALMSSTILMVYTVLQPLVYGYVFVEIWVRQLTVLGCLMLFVASRLLEQNASIRVSNASAATIALDGLQMVGRLLVTITFVGEALLSDYGGLHGVLSAPSLSNSVVFLALCTFCLTLVLGFCTEASSVALSVGVLLANFLLYPFWSAGPDRRDTLMFFFFQNLSIAGGLLLLGSQGPGVFSVDGKAMKKD